MKRAQYSQRGPVPQDVIDAVAFSAPALAPGQVLIKVLAAPINPSDVLTLTGQYGMLPPLPAIQTSPPPLLQTLPRALVTPEAMAVQVVPLHLRTAPLPPAIQASPAAFTCAATGSPRSSACTISCVKLWACLGSASVSTVTNWPWRA